MESVKLKVVGIGLLALSLMGFPLAGLAEEPVYKITIKDHKFLPEALTIPSNTKVKIVVENFDSTAEEFESYDLRREKVVSAHGEIIIFIGPLKAGVYKYFGDFHQQTAQGRIVAGENG